MHELTSAPGRPAAVAAPLHGAAGMALKDAQVLILGLGHSGLAMARWCGRSGAAGITVADTREAPPQATALAVDVPAARLWCGPFDAALVEGMSGFASLNVEQQAAMKARLITTIRTNTYDAGANRVTLLRCPCQ